MKGDRIFVLSCWGLGLIAFLQLLIAGMALAARMEAGRQVKIVEREVEKIVPIRVAAPPSPEPSTSTLPESILAKKPEEPEPAPKPEALVVPPIADPRTENLVTAGRKARVAGDMGLAIVKLEEALAQSPGDSSVIYELGMVHEAMGIYDKAADYYEQVFQLGIAGAGELYHSAATKLRDGFEQPSDMRGNLALGRVRIFQDTKAKDGQRVVLSVPVQKAPDAKVESQEIEVAVTFFNKTEKGKIVQLEDETWAQATWATLPFDWASGEETLRMNYVIPQQNEPARHLFGTLSYYGQIVVLSYKGEVLDVQAWPRDLAAKLDKSSSLGQQGNDFPEFLEQDTLPPNFDPEIPLLNPLQAE